MHPGFGHLLPEVVAGLEGSTAPIGEVGRQEFAEKNSHKGKQTRDKNVEVRLRVWMMDRRDHRIVVTRRMVMSRAKLWDARLAALTDLR